MNQNFPENVTAGPDGQPAAAAMVPVAFDAGTADTQHTIGGYRVELEMQNAELCRVHEELEAAKARYFDLYDTASVGFCEIGKDGLIRQTNQASALLLEMDSQHLARKPFINFIHREDRLIYQRFCRQIEETGASQFCELRLKRAGKDPLWADLRGAWKIAESGEVEMRLATSHINARKLLEVQSQKMQRSASWPVGWRMISTTSSRAS
jgi:two-component system cell cycle sensor histidine kinase/response regulator CckA